MVEDAMDFGKITQSSALDRAKIDLPVLEPRSIRVLEYYAKLRRSAEPSPFKLYVGCPIWGKKEWVGTLYPKGTQSQDFLKHYATNLGILTAMFPLASTPASDPLGRPLSLSSG